MKQVARPLSVDELAGEVSSELVRDMFETLSEAGGVGLAAPQVGESVRLILAGSFPSGTNPTRPVIPVRLFVNPTVIQSSEETEGAWEGCLSIRNLLVRVIRPSVVRVEYLGADGGTATIEAEGFLARVLQHEIDHLDGILTLDRARSDEDIRWHEG